MPSASSAAPTVITLVRVFMDASSLLLSPRRSIRLLAVLHRSHHVLVDSSVRTARRIRCGCNGGVAAQFGVAMDLIRSEQSSRRKMVFEMRVAQCALKLTDSRGCGRKPLGGDGAVGEGGIEVAFSRYELLSERHGFRLHRIEQLLNTCALLVGQANLAGKIKHVAGTGITIQFGRERKPHAFAGAELGNLFWR